MTDRLRRNASLAEMLGGALREGGHALGSVPSLLKQLLESGGWREFTTQRGEHVTYERFADFVTTQPLKGLGASVELLRRIVADDPRVLDLLDQALQNPVGHPAIGSNRTNSKTGGTTKAQALRRLRKDAPELHAQVLAGNLTAHAAMVQAGYRPRTFTVRTDPAAAARTLRKHMAPEQITELTRLLNGGGQADD